MSPNRRNAAVWAAGMAVLAAAVAGSAVTASTPARELQYIAGFGVAFALALYVLIVRQWAVWRQKHPFLRFVVFFLGAFVAMTALDLLVGLLAGGYGGPTTALEVVAVLCGFGVAVWLTLFGGAERLWDVVVPWLGLEW